MRAAAHPARSSHSGVPAQREAAGQRSQYWLTVWPCRRPPGRGPRELIYEGSRQAGPSSIWGRRGPGANGSPQLEHETAGVTTERHDGQVTSCSYRVPFRYRLPSRSLRTGSGSAMTGANPRTSNATRPKTAPRQNQLNALRPFSPASQPQSEPNATIQMIQTTSNHMTDSLVFSLPLDAARARLNDARV
jgi:hypothetical protein